MENNDQIIIVAGGKNHFGLTGTIIQVNEHDVLVKIKISGVTKLFDKRNVQLLPKFDIGDKVSCFTSSAVLEVQNIGDNHTYFLKTELGRIITRHASRLRKIEPKGFQKGDYVTINLYSNVNFRKVMVLDKAIWENGLGVCWRMTSLVSKNKYDYFEIWLDKTKNPYQELIDETKEIVWQL
jgi:hypothetical protein